MIKSAHISPDTLADIDSDRPMQDGTGAGDLVRQLSTAKSPQQMFGAVMKTYFAEKLGVSPEKIYTVSVMPCVAKKGEKEMELLSGICGT